MTIESLTNPGDDREHFGIATADMVRQVYDQGADRAVLLMRHSARTFDRSIHDLLNPLTEHGRNLTRKFGQLLPKDVLVRGYASPPERCVETAQLAIAAHEADGGEGLRTRPVEALGVFYALDQQKMWKGLSQADGLADYVGQWFNEDVPRDAMIPAPLAVELLLRVLIEKLYAPGAQRQLDLCVTHDMTVYTMRHGVGLEPVTGPDVEFLDGLILFERDGSLRMRSHHGGEVKISEQTL
ncbi:MAG: histidine phosphatase family protein [Pseudomonadota bacterium]